MNSKKLTGAGAAALVSATAVVALVLGSSTAAAGEARPSSAFGLSTSGALPIDPLPSVVSKDGKLVRDELLGLSKVPGAGAAGITAGLFTVQAERGAAETSVAQLNIPGLLRGDLIRTSCVNGHGRLQIVNGSVLGHQLPSDSETNQTIDVSPLLRVSLGEETKHKDGTVTVTGIKLEVLPSAGKNLDRQLTDNEKTAVPALGGLLGTKLAPSGTARGLVDQLSSSFGKSLDLSSSLQTVTIGSATCGVVTGVVDRGEPEEGDTNNVVIRNSPDEENVPEAPEPTIVVADLPVTH